MFKSKMVVHAVRCQNKRFMKITFSDIIFAYIDSFKEGPGHH